MQSTILEISSDLSAAKFPLTYSVKETAAILGVSSVTVYRLLQRGTLTALPGLRTKRITRQSLQRYLDAAS